MSVSRRELSLDEAGYVHVRYGVYRSPLGGFTRNPKVYRSEGDGYVVTEHYGTMELDPNNRFPLYGSFASS